VSIFAGRKIITRAETPSDEWLDLDRSPLFAIRIARLARFRGGMLRLGPITRRTGPIFGQLLMRSLRCPAAVSRARGRLLLYPGRDCLTNPLLLVLAEWMEYRRTATMDDCSLWIHTAADQSGRALFDVVAPLWEHVQSLKSQLNVTFARTFVLADYGSRFDESKYAPLADAVLAIPPVSDCGRLIQAAEQCEIPIVCPSQYAGKRLKFGYETEPAVLKSQSTADQLNDLTRVYEVPKPFAIANAIRRLAIDWRARAGSEPQEEPEIQRLTAMGSSLLRAGPRPVCHRSGSR
jgi:hypothetical protein